MLGTGRALFGGGSAYRDKVLGLDYANLIGYWPMDESSGSVAYDLSSQGNNGAYTGVTLGQPGIGDGRTCPLFDGANDYNNIIGSDIENDFSGTEGTFSTWMFPHADAHDDSTIRRPLLIWTDANNYIIVAHTGNDGDVQFDYRAGGTSEQGYISIASAPTDFEHFAFTWSDSNDQVIYYHNGSQVGAIDTGIGTWSGAITVFVIGAGSIVPANPYYGRLAHPNIWKAVLSPGNIKSLATR